MYKKHQQAPLKACPAEQQKHDRSNAGSKDSSMVRMVYDSKTRQAQPTLLSSFSHQPENHRRPPAARPTQNRSQRTWTCCCDAWKTTAAASFEACFFRGDLLPILQLCKASLHSRALWTDDLKRDVARLREVLHPLQTTHLRIPGFHTAHNIKVLHRHQNTAGPVTPPRQTESLRRWMTHNELGDLLSPSDAILVLNAWPRTTRDIGAALSDFLTETNACFEYKFIRPTASFPKQTNTPDPLPVPRDRRDFGRNPSGTATTGRAATTPPSAGNKWIATCLPKAIHRSRFTSPPAAARHEPHVSGFSTATEARRCRAFRKHASSTGTASPAKDLQDHTAFQKAVDHNPERRRRPSP